MQVKISASIGLRFSKIVIIIIIIIIIINNNSEFTKLAINNFGRVRKIRKNDY